MLIKIVSLIFRFEVLLVLLAALSGCGNTPLPETNVGEAPQVTPVAVTPVTLANGWQRYHDPDLGFSFSYPPETRLTSGKNKFGTTIHRLQFRLPGVNNYQGMVIRAEENPENLPVEAIVSRLYEQSTQELVPEELLAQLEPITVAGLPAIKTDLLATNAEFSILFLHQGRIFILAPVHDAALTQVDNQALDLFYQVVQTLAFDS